MKPSFTVAGVTFDTQEVYKGWNAYSDAALAQKVECDVVREGNLPHITDEAVLKKHGNLFQRFSEIAKKFNLPKQPLLGVSNYGFPFIATGTSGSIMMDSSVLKLLEPEELDGILAHEFSHLELKHNGKGDKHEDEFAADKLAAERTGDSKGLRSGLHKMDQFKEGLRQASFRYKMLEGTSRVATNIHGAFAGKQTRYPATSQRTDRLEKLDPSFADREKGESSSERSGPG
jgi:Zn-dependent protease with chaperone function